MTDRIPDRNVYGLSEGVIAGMEAISNAAPTVGDMLVKHELSLLRANDRIKILAATLQGVRGMAETEAANGSNAWRKAIVIIDEALK